MSRAAEQLQSAKSPLVMRSVLQRFQPRRPGST
jgi:hypothetical protein